MTTKLKGTKDNLAIAYDNFMRQYFHLVKMVLGETIEQGNNWIITSDSTEIDWKEYENKTTWSDFNLIMPVLFSLYHGLELSMKAVLAINDRNVTGHKLITLYTEVKNQPGVPNNISSILSKYIEVEKSDSFLSDFLKTNECSIDDYYDFLKYPTDKNSATIKNYWPVKYKQESVLETYKNIIEDLSNLSREVQQYIKDKLSAN